MVQTIGPQGNIDYLINKINSMEARLNALGAQQTVYLTTGNSIYVIDGNGNAQIIIGDMSAAPSGVGTTGATFNVSTGLSGRGLAVLVGNTWCSLQAYTYP